MANPGYVRSTDGVDTDNGSTWALANATASGAMTDAVAGDRIFFSQVHAESTAAAVTINCPGTLASPCQLICANDAAEPPTAVATTGVVAVTGANSLTVNGCFYAYGLTFSAGSAANNSSLFLAQSDNNHQHHKSCGFTLANSNASGRITIGASSTSTETSLLTENCTFTFGATSQGFNLRMGHFVFRGGAIAGSAITALIATTMVTSIDALFDGVDLSAGAAAMNLLPSGVAASGRVIFRNIKLPPSWTGGLLAGAPVNMSFRAELHNGDATDTTYRMWVETYAGSIKSETAVVRSGGASDGDVPLSWRMAGSANCRYPLIALDAPEIARRFPGTSAEVSAWVPGATKTVTVEVLTDGVTLTNADFAVEVQYLGTNGYPLGVVTSSAKADVLAAATAYPASSESWDTTGLTSPVKQTVSVSITPWEKGVLLVTLKLTKASTTIYVCPKIMVA